MLLVKVQSRLACLPTVYDVYVMGRNDDGQLGLGSTRRTHYEPTVVGKLQHRQLVAGPLAISCGVGFNSLAL